MKDLESRINGDVLVKCEHVSKKFCRGLKRSLWYGILDICGELNPFHKQDKGYGKGNTQSLRKDEFWAINDISFELKRGDCLGLIGHNGAGKSTLLKMLNGLIKPDHGRISMKGRVGALIELSAGFNPILTGRENVYINGAILGFTKKEIDQKYDAIVDFSEMHNFMEMPFRSYSSGMKVRLGFAVAAQMEPDVLIIDEVLSVGDLAFRVKCMTRIGELMKCAAVIFVSHQMELVSHLCHKVMLLNKAQKIFFGETVSGINLYLEEQPLTEKILHTVDWISNVHVTQDKFTLNYREGLRIELEFTAEKAHPECVARICFINRTNRVVAEWRSTTHNLLLDIEKGSNRFLFNIQSLPLAKGNYTINFNLQPRVSPQYLISANSISSLKIMNGDRSAYSVLF